MDNWTDTTKAKYQLAICSYIYNNGMPDLNVGYSDVKCTECDESYLKENSFWVAGLITCQNCLPYVAQREAKKL